MKKIIFILFLFSSVIANAQIYSNNTANAALFLRYDDTTGVHPVIGSKTVAFIFRSADSSLYWYTNGRKTWTLYTTNGSPTWQQTLTSGSTLTTDNSVSMGAHIFTWNGTGAIILPAGTTAQRPSSPVAYMVRGNTDSSKLEFYTSSAWATIGGSTGGGSTSPGGSDKYLQFNDGSIFGGVSAFQVDKTNAFMTITTTGLAATETLTSGLLIVGGDAATSGNQKISAPLILRGHGWGTTAGTSQNVDYLQDVLPVQGTVPVGKWRLRNSVAGGTITDAMMYNPTGNTLQLTGGSGTGILYLTNTTASNFISGSTRSDIVFSNGSISARSTWTVNGSTTVNDPNTFTSGLWNSVSTTLPQFNAAYNTTTYTLTGTGSTGIYTITPTGITTKLTASTTAGASLNLPTSATVNPTSPGSGDLWWNGTNLNFRTASSTIDLLAGGSGMTNPLTTTGDIIYSSSGTTPARLGIGSATNVLTVVSGLPAWSALPVAVADGSTKGIAAFNSADFNSASGVISIKHDSLSFNTAQFTVTHLTSTHDSVELNNITSGSYTPTLTNTTNLSSTTLSQAYYTRIGNIVTVTIGLLTTATTNSLTTVLTFTLPVTTSNGSQSNTGSGSIAVNSGTVFTSGIVNITSTTQGTFTWVPSLNTSSPASFTFQYSL